MSNLADFLRLIRLHNLPLVLASVLVGGWLESGRFLSSDILIAALSAALIAAFGYTHNDYCDQQIDKINKPNRPLPRQGIRPYSALRFSLLLATSGVILSLMVNYFAPAIAALAVLLLLLYNRVWKKSFLLGNGVVSILTAGPFIYGGVAVKKVSLCLVPALFSFLFHFGREILKDLEDQQADREAKAKTLSVRLGEGAALRTATFIYLFLMLSIFIPYIWGLFNQRYLVLAVLGVNLLLLYVLWSVWKDDSVQNLSRVNSLLKLGMFLGLAAILAGRL